MATRNTSKTKTLTAAQRTSLKLLLRGECSHELEESVMDEFLSLGSVVSYKRGEVICRAGTLDRNIYIIIEGIICRWRWNDSKETVDTFALPGTLFTEYHCYYAGKESHAFFEACCPTLLLKVPAREYDELINRSHEFAKWCLCMAQCQLYTYEIREINLNGSVRDRYMTLMGHRPDIIRQVPLRTIAAYLGVSPQYLSTLRTKWLMKGGKD